MKLKFCLKTFLEAPLKNLALILKLFVLKLRYNFGQWCCHLAPYYSPHLFTSGKYRLYALSKKHKSVREYNILFFVKFFSLFWMQAMQLCLLFLQKNFTQSLSFAVLSEATSN